jgi:hypothetical protein
MEDIDASVDHSTPVWAVFGDLMAGLLGAFVLILVGVLGVQLELVTSLESEIQKRQQEDNAAKPSKRPWLAHSPPAA